MRRKKRQDIPERLLEKISGRTRERVSDQPSESMSEGTQQEKGQPERSPGDIPDRTSSWQTQCKKTPTRYAKSAWMSERTSEDMSDRMWDGMLSKQERISEGTSKDCWKDMPERMSEWMPFTWGHFESYLFPRSQIGWNRVNVQWFLRSQERSKDFKSAASANVGWIYRVFFLKICSPSGSL